MRLFLAIDTGDETREHIASARADLAPHFRAVRWVATQNLHLTLRFIGEAEPDLVDRLDGELRDAIGKETPFDLAFRGYGVFPDQKRPRVLWVGAHNPPKVLFRLHEASDRALGRLGIGPEKRPFRPHLTIARFKGRERSLTDTLRGVSDRSAGTVVVEEVVLYQSRLLPEGATYLPVRRFPLAGTGPKELLQY